jgi:hypothetical protein
LDNVDIFARHGVAIAIFIVDCFLSGKGRFCCIRYRKSSAAGKDSGMAA